jgi:hypothetical protein
MLRAYLLSALNWIGAILLRYGSGSLPSKNGRRRARFRLMIFQRIRMTSDSTLARL